MLTSQSAFNPSDHNEYWISEVTSSLGTSSPERLLDSIVMYVSAVSNISWGLNSAVEGIVGLHDVTDKAMAHNIFCGEIAK